MDWSLKKCCRVRARRRRRAEGEGAFAELCSSVRGARRPSPPACPPAVASAAAAAAAAAPWPRPTRAPAASPRHPPASPASAGVGSGPSGCLPRPLPSPGVLVKGRGRARAGEGEDRSGSAAEPNGDSHPAICLGGDAGTHTARTADRGPLPRLEPGEAQPVTGERPLPSPSCNEFLWISINWREWGLCPGRRKTLRGGGPGTPRRPRAPPAPLRPRGPVALRAGVRRGDWAAAGTAAGSAPAPGLNTATIWHNRSSVGGTARRGARCDRLWNWVHFFNLVITFQGVIFLLSDMYAFRCLCAFSRYSPKFDSWWGERHWEMTLACNSLLRMVKRIRWNVFSSYKI